MKAHPIEFHPIDMSPGPIPTRWGRWRYQACNYTLHNDATYYEVDLEEVTDRDSAFAWILHCQEKSFFDAADISSLIDAFHDIFDLYSRAPFDVTSSAIAKQEETCTCRECATEDPTEDPTEEQGS